MKRRQKFDLFRKEEEHGEKEGPSSDEARKESYFNISCFYRCSLSIISRLYLQLEGLIGYIGSTAILPEGCLTMGKHKYSSYGY